MAVMKNARKAARVAEQKFANRVREYAKSHSAGEADLAMFKDALGYGRVCDTLLASDLTLRRKSAIFLGAALERLREENPNLSFQFWTFIHERGNTSDREPRIDLKFLQVLMDKTMRDLKLNSIGVIESQGLGNHPREGNGRTIMTHPHAISWSANDMDYAKVAKALNEKGPWRNELGADPVRVKPVREGKGELEYLAYYLFKPPYDVKMLENRQRGDRLKSTEKGYKPEFAARLLEMLSQLELKELVRASGEGKIVRRNWNRRLTNWHRSREEWTSGKLPAFYFDDFWDRYRMRKKKKLYLPYTIIR
ncbi:hypothetical protein OAS19_00305 [Altererythrobacter sp.]|nr:hypothetical protein [Altererythrobacter sp.]